MVRKNRQVESRLSGCVTVCMLRCRNSGGRRLTHSLTSVYVMILCVDQFVDGCVSKYFWAVSETFSHLLGIAPSGQSCTGTRRAQPKGYKPREDEADRFEVFPRAA